MARSPGRPRQPHEDKRNIREELLDAALELFGTQGVAATSVATIAARVGVTPAMSLYYFKNREQLLDVVVAERLIPLIDEVWSDFAPSSDPDALETTQAIKNLLVKLVGKAQEYPWLRNIWLTEILADNGHLRSRLMPYMAGTYLQIFMERFAQAQTQGLINPTLVPILTLGSLLGGTLLPMIVAPLASPVITEENVGGLVLKNVMELFGPGIVRQDHVDQAKGCGKESY